MAKCYASALGDCSGKISREHYFSEGILKLLLEHPKWPTARGSIAGLPWLKPGGPQPSIASLTAKILCEHHNSELSPLDSTALEFFDFLDTWKLKLMEGQAVGTFEKRIQGELLERWTLKVLLGNLAAKNLGRAGRRVTARPALQTLEYAFGRRPMPWRNGLYLYSPPSSKLLGQRILRFAPLFLNESLAGAVFDIHGIELVLAAHPDFAARYDSNPTHAVYRAAGIQLTRTNPTPATARLSIDWVFDGSNDGLKILLDPQPKQT